MKAIATPRIRGSSSMRNCGFVKPGIQNRTHAVLNLPGFTRMGLLLVVGILAVGLSDTCKRLACCDGCLWDGMCRNAKSGFPSANEERCTANGGRWYEETIVDRAIVVGQKSSVAGVRQRTRHLQAEAAPQSSASRLLAGALRPEIISSSGRGVGPSCFVAGSTNSSSRGRSICTTARCCGLRTRSRAD
jgi:hypothetical protein